MTLLLPRKRSVLGIERRNGQVVTTHFCAIRVRRWPLVWQGLWSLEFDEFHAIGISGCCIFEKEKINPEHRERGGCTNTNRFLAFKQCVNLP